MDIKFQIIRTFGPSVFKVKIPDEIIKSLNVYIDSIVEDKKRISKLNHGEAVILGIVSAAKFSVKNNILKNKDYEQIISHINNIKIPVNLNYYFKKKHINSIIKYMKSDKKNISQKINLILLKQIGKAILDLRYDHSKIKKFLINELVN